MLARRSTRAATQATASTCTGWMAKMRAARMATFRVAPMARTRRLTRKITATCRRMLVRWKPAGFSPQRVESNASVTASVGR
jgi:hypothetical protein